MRIALYSHDALGLGHLRRNLAIARSLAEQGDHSTLLVTGMRDAAAFPAPDGVDYLTVPGYAKDGAGGYRPRFLRTTTERLLRLRADTMRAALDAFAPHAFIVDKHPLGVYGELEPALDVLADHGTTCILGLRDVLDEPERVRTEWAVCRGADVVRDRYADVWVYGDRRVYDVVRECSLGEAVAERAHFTGYLALGRRPSAGGEQPAEGLDVPDGDLALCLVGGGEDGFAVADAFATAPMPSGTQGVLVTGPLMPAEQRERLRARAGARVQVLDFVLDPTPLIERATSVVTMGGYNTVCELLAEDKRMLVVPRVAPRSEQLIRARRLARRGLVDVLHPSRVRASALGAWLDPRSCGRRRRRGSIDLEGLRRLPGLLDDALGVVRPAIVGDGVRAG